MRYKTLYTGTLIFFLLINTVYYWEDRLGMFAMPMAVVLFIYYIFLLVVGVQQVYHLFKERFRDRQRLVGAVLLLLVLIITYLHPQGIIDFHKTSAKDLLIATTKGRPDCNTVFTLKDDDTFLERNDCGGITEITGYYVTIGDTIYFKDVDMGGFENNYYQYAIIRGADATKGSGAMLVRYMNPMDKEGNRLFITTDKLKR